MTRLRLLILLLLPLLGGALLANDEISGIWNGTFEPANGESSGAYVDLKVDGTTVTGLAGPSAGEAAKITNGKFENGLVTFDVTIGDVTLKVELRLVDGKLAGKANAEVDGNKMEAVLKFTKKT